MNLNFIVGFGTGLMTREVVLGMQKVLRPMVKNLLKAGYISFQKGSEGIGKVGESFEDMIAEIKNENHQLAAKSRLEEESDLRSDDKAKGKEHEERPKGRKEGKDKMSTREESANAPIH